MSFLDRESLASCALVNTAFNEDTNKVLWKAYTIAPRRTDPGRRDVEQACDAIVRDPRRALLIRKLTISPMKAPGSAAGAHLRDPPLLNQDLSNRLGAVFEAIRYLLDLHILEIPDSWKPILPRVLTSRRWPFQLRIFETTMELDLPIVVFFHVQPSIDSILIQTGDTNVPTIPATILPNLTSILGPVSVIVALVPGRPIFSIAVANPITSQTIRPFLQVLPLSSVPVRQMWLDFTDPTSAAVGPALSWLAQAAKSLRVLDIAYRLQPDIIDESEGGNMVPTLIGTFPELVDLRCMILRGGESYAPSLEELVRDWGADSDSLLSLGFDLDNGGPLYKREFETDWQLAAE